jgi:hypothetical protein
MRAKRLVAAATAVALSAGISRNRQLQLTAAVNICQGKEC